MSSLFSYELDEAQIRLTLQDSRAVVYNESNWDEFETKFGGHHSNQNNSKFKLPEFNLNINRNVVLPIVFITCLVGVSAIMLSFVDFKTNAPVQVEKQLIPDPDNFKQEKTKTAVIVKKEPVQKVIEKPIEKADPVPAKIETPVVNTSPSAIITNQVATNHSRNSSNSTNTNSQSRVIKSDTGSVTGSVPANIIPQSQNNTGKKRKKRRKVNTDQIETIKAPALLGQQEADKEPELELKLN